MYDSNFVDSNVFMYYFNFLFMLFKYEPLKVVFPER